MQSGVRRHLNRDALHRYFWRNRDEQQRRRIHFWELAEELGVSYDTTRFAVRRMIDEGRLVKVAHSIERGRGSHVGVYRVADPAIWEIDDSNTHAAAQMKANRTLQWS
jgi:DNA-binding transcriptional regulator PaaX